VYVVNTFIRFGVDPAIGSTTTRKRESMRTFIIDNGEFQLAIKRRTLYQLPCHTGIMLQRLTSVFDLNQLSDAW
jgi:hypothetical protein